MPVVTQPDPIAEFDAFPKNSRAHAAFWLQHGYLHPEAHHIIVARLAPWISRLAAAGAEVLGKLRARVLAQQAVS